MKPTLNQLLLSALLAAASASMPRPTHAETQAQADTTAEPNVVESAQLLFDKAMELMAAGKYVRACRLFEESLRLDAAMGTHYRLAECYEQTGRFALAWSTFTTVARAAEELGNTDREERASERAAVLGPRIGKVSITVPPSLSEIPGLEISFDDHVIRPGRWIGGAHLIEAADPGHHWLQATAPGKIPWRHRFLVKASTMTGVTVPMLESKQAPPLLQRAPRAEAARNRVVVFAGSAAAVAIIGAGVGLIVTSNAAAVKRDDGIRGLQTELQQPSGAQVCAENTPAAVECSGIARWDSQAQRLAKAATAAFVVGGALAVATTSVALLSWKRRASGRIEVSAGAGPSGIGVDVRGAF